MCVRERRGDVVGDDGTSIRAESVDSEKEKDGTYISLDMLKKKNEWWTRALKCEKTPVDISELPDLSKRNDETHPKTLPVGKSVFSPQQRTNSRARVRLCGE